MVIINYGPSKIGVPLGMQQCTQQVGSFSTEGGLLEMHER
jgi:hypothetical protein